MKKENSIIIGSGVIGSYLAKLLITKKKQCYSYFKKNKKKLYKLQKVKYRRKNYI